MGKEMGYGVRVVSMPCMERFDRQSDSYKEEVLPSACRKRVAIEAVRPVCGTSTLASMVRSLESTDSVSLLLVTLFSRNSDSPLTMWLRRQTLFNYKVTKYMVLDST